jgi:hypothetical protein
MAIVELITLRIKSTESWYSILPDLQRIVFTLPAIHAVYSGVDQDDTSVVYWIIVWESMEGSKASLLIFLSGRVGLIDKIEFQPISLFQRCHANVEGGIEGATSARLPYC